MKVREHRRSVRHALRQSRRVRAREVRPWLVSSLTAQVAPAPWRPRSATHRMSGFRFARTQHSVRWYAALIRTFTFMLATLAAAQEDASTHVVPLFPAVSDTGPQGLVRIVNHSNRAGSVAIVAIDAAGTRVEGLGISIGASQTAHFDSDDLESGNPEAGLSGSTGPGEGDWHLELASDLNIELQAYAYGDGGVLDELLEAAVGDGEGFRIATFDPGDDNGVTGLLRLLNRSGEAIELTVRGTDDLGVSPGPGVTIELAAWESKTYTASELESGEAPGLTGSLGDGTGLWRLDGEAPRQVMAMSLVEDAAGRLANLSGAPAREFAGAHRVPLFPPASDALGREGLVRVINRSDAAGEVRIEAFDGTELAYEALTLALRANEAAQFDSNDLELGNTAKGLTGSTGAGEGDWRLELTSDLDIEVLSYVRAAGDRLSPMHEAAAREPDGLRRHYVPIFHSAEQEGQESRLHLFNAGESETRVSIAGTDDAGDNAPEGRVALTLNPGETRVLTAAALEDGGDGFEGRFGTGAGRWRMFVTSYGMLQVMGLGYGEDGEVANLSRGDPADSGLLVIDARVGNLDLVVESVSVDEGVRTPDSAFVLSATVRNLGMAPAEATMLRYYLSPDTTITPSDRVVGTDPVDELAASATSAESITLLAPSAEGTYYYGACVDAVPAESDTANNCSASTTVIVYAPPPDRPDLVVASPSASNARPAPGEAFTLSATVRNRGAGAASATTLRYYLSADTTITPSDMAVGTDPVDELAASATSAESITLLAPSAEGTYYYGACVDAVPAESDTANNCSASTTVIVYAPPPDRPDLVVASPSASNARPAPGEAFTLSATVRNRGAGAASATTLRYYLSADTTITPSDMAVGTDPVDELAASATSAESITLLAPSAEGTYYYGACVDAVPAESDTANNCSASATVTVYAPPPDRPDLVVASPSASNARPAPGEAFTLSATVRNRGAGAASATTLRYYLSADTTITPSDMAVGTDPVDELAASATSAESITLLAPSEEGTYYYGACVDAVATESDTANNCSSAVPVTVPAPPSLPDLVVVSPSTRLHDGPDATFTLSATVRNQGEGAASATTLRYYRSGDSVVSTADAPVGTDSVPALAASGSSGESIDLAVPPAGTYHFGACVDAVPRESDTTNNCSSAVLLTVSEPQSFGATAIDVDNCRGPARTDAWGLVVDQKSKEAAEKLAIAECVEMRTRGGNGGEGQCRGTARTFEQCGAIASGYNANTQVCWISSDAGPSQGEAEQKVLSRCRGNTESECQLLDSGCNSTD